MPSTQSVDLTTDVRILQNAVADYRDRVVPDLNETLKDAVGWIAYEIVGNEIQVPLPASLKPHLALALIADDRLGWPDLDSALGFLDEREWA